MSNSAKNESENALSRAGKATQDAVGGVYQGITSAGGAVVEGVMNAFNNGSGNHPSTTAKASSAIDREHATMGPKEDAKDSGVEAKNAAGDAIASAGTVVKQKALGTKQSAEDAADDAAQTAQRKKKEADEYASEKVNQAYERGRSGMVNAADLVQEAAQSAKTSSRKQ
jgi:hypothetical protein